MKSWFLPENLKEAERNTRKQRLNEVDPNNDFGSYKIMLETGDASLSRINCHNDTAPVDKIFFLKKRLNKAGFHTGHSDTILTVGCGLGFETKAISEAFDAKVLGIDISDDAISYAKHHFENERVKFRSLAVDGSMKLEEKSDLCFAIEFYPFSRTDDIVFHTEIIKAIFENLNSNGFLVIFQVWDNNNSIRDNIPRIAESLNKKVYLSPFMHKRLNEKTGDNFFSVTLLTISRFISKLIGKPFLKPSRMIVFYNK